MKKIVIPVLLLMALVSIVFIACSKDNADKPTTLKVRLTDNPVAAEQVNVDIQQVRVKFSDDSIQGWNYYCYYNGCFIL